MIERTGKVKPVYVFGHRNPDTDAICSAIAYADLLARTTTPNAVAACCGPPNARTVFALEKAGVETPRIIMDVTPRAADLCRPPLATARETDVFYEVYERLKEHGIRTIPTVSYDGTCTGLISLLDIMELVLGGGGQSEQTRKVDSSLENVRRILGGEFQHSVVPEVREELIVMVGAMSAHGFAQNLDTYPAERLLVVSGDRPTIQLPALEKGVRALVVTGGYQLSSGLLQLAEANDVTVITSPYDTATTTLLVKTAKVVEPAICRNFTTIPDNTTINDIKRIVDRQSQPLYPVLDDEDNMVGVLTKSDLVNSARTKLILVDHNELSQAVQGAEQADIIEVLDHHRLGGGLRSSQPIRFVNQPVGSTCTLVADRFRFAGIQPEPGIALCMASGIISDTLHLKSPTTTQTDIDTIQWLQQFCDIDFGDYAKQFFEVGSSLRSCAPKQVVIEDCKEFTECGS
ncbi:MAG: putative manganese-dependent inorganic diphosphatase, partial [Planctomycetales bacterium]|nr:putative manganese-dependent inorganic diphosphatase [Planctomycetales bacterium]